MRGKQHSQFIKEKCLKMRKEGCSLNEISKVFKIPKTTIHDWCSQGVVLSLESQSRLQKKIIKGRLKGNTSSNRKSLIVIPLSLNWSPDLVSIVSHFMFDGYPTSRLDGYVYCSRNISQIKTINKLMNSVFGLKPHLQYVKNNIIRSRFYSVRLAKYINLKKRELLEIIPNAPRKLKIAFLKAFFDDEGAITFKKNIKKVRGFQHSEKILTIAKQLLMDFNINSYIDKRKIEITISGKENLLKFQKEINFSSCIYMNPNRKNALWKYKIEKREILKKAICSYEKH